MTSGYCSVFVLCFIFSCHFIESLLYYSATFLYDGMTLSAYCIQSGSQNSTQNLGIISRKIFSRCTDVGTLKLSVISLCFQLCGGALMYFSPKVILAHKSLGFMTAE